MYIKVNGNERKATHLEVKTYYSLGGYNCFTYERKARGYYVSVTPVRKWVTASGVGMVEFTAFTGYSKFIQEATRLSKKTLAKIDNNLIENTREIIERVLEEQGLTLAETPEEAWNKHINGIS